MVERTREVGWCDYCLVGSQKNRSAQKYVVRERGSVSDIINTLETYSENACAHSSAHERMCAQYNSCLARTWQIFLQDINETRNSKFPLYI